MQQSKSSMQRTPWLRLWLQFPHTKCPRVSVHSIFQYQRSRKLTTQQTPGFGSSNPSSTAPRPSKTAEPTSGAGKPSSKERNDSGKSSPREANKTKPTKKSPIGPRRIFIYSTLAYVWYRVYIWHTAPDRCRILDPYNFTVFILEKRKRVSSTSSILNLKSVPKGQNTDNVTEAWQKGVWSVQAIQPELQIARSYTPLPPSEDAEPEELRLFVRKEPQGEVSSFLDRIPRGVLVHLRGPHIEYEIPEDVDQVLFLAGGTGIAPALQIAHILHHCRSSAVTNGPKMRILWANRRREDSYLGPQPLSLEQPQSTLAPNSRNLADTMRRKSEKEVINPEGAKIPQLQPQTALVAELELLKAKYPGKIEIEYFVDEDGSHINKSLLNNHLQSTNKEPELETQDHSIKKKLVIISGPEGFVEYYAGPKSMRGGKELQGPLGGVLQQLNTQGWEVWKL